MTHSIPSPTYDMPCSLCTATSSTSSALCVDGLWCTCSKTDLEARPPHVLREEVLTSIDALKAREEMFQFAHHIAGMLWVSPQDATRLLERSCRQDSWKDAGVEGVAWMHVQTPRPNVHASFLKLEALSVFPEHRHLGRESVLVLRGLCQDSAGGVYRAGDLFTHEEGSCHWLRARGKSICISLAVVEGDGIEFSKAS